MKLISYTFFILLILSIQTVSAQSENAGLKIADHENIKTLVESMTEDGLEIGLTENRVQSRTEVRLRQVQLTPITNVMGSSFLYVKVSVVGNAFSIELSFHRRVFFNEDPEDYKSDILTASANVYTQGGRGTHGYDSEYIIEALDTKLDLFISDYLRAND